MNTLQDAIKEYRQEQEKALRKQAEEILERIKIDENVSRAAWAEVGLVPDAISGLDAVFVENDVAYEFHVYVSHGAYYFSRYLHNCPICGQRLKTEDRIMTLEYIGWAMSDPTPTYHDCLPFSGPVAVKQEPDDETLAILDLLHSDPVALAMVKAFLLIRAEREDFQQALDESYGQMEYLGQNLERVAEKYKAQAQDAERRAEEEKRRIQDDLDDAERKLKKAERGW